MRLTRISTGRVVGVGVAALLLSGGGIALAANGMNLPFEGHDARSDRAPAAPASTNPGLDRAESVIDGPAAAPESTGADEGSPSDPTPSFQGLCVAYENGAFRNGKSAAFAALVDAAGGVEDVSAYCADQVEVPKARPARPTRAADPSRPEGPGKPAEGAVPAPAKPTQAPVPPKPTEAAPPTIPDRPAPPTR